MVALTSQRSASLELVGEVKQAVDLARRSLGIIDPVHLKITAVGNDGKQTSFRANLEVLNGTLLISSPSDGSPIPKEFGNGGERIMEVRFMTGRRMPTGQSFSGQNYVRGYYRPFNGKLETGHEHLRALAGQVVEVETYVTDDGAKAERSGVVGRVGADGSHIKLSSPCDSQLALGKVSTELRTVTRLSLLQIPQFWEPSGNRYDLPEKFSPGAEVMLSLRGQNQPANERFRLVDMFKDALGQTLVLALKGTHQTWLVSENDIEAMWTPGTDRANYLAFTERAKGLNSQRDFKSLCEDYQSQIQTINSWTW